MPRAIHIAYLNFRTACGLRTAKLKGFTTDTWDKVTCAACKEKRTKP